MQKIWILECLYTPEEMQKDLALYEKMLDTDDIKNNEESLELTKKMLENTKQMIAENPNGKWIGHQGKIIYRQFCECALETMGYFKNKKQYRVVEALIEENSRYWLNYEVVKENPGVLKCLLSQVKYR